MKGFYLFSSAVAAAALSALGIMMFSGRTASPPAAESAVVPLPVMVPPEQSRAVEALLREISARQDEQEKREKALQELEAQTKQEHILLVRMQDELSAAQRDMEKRFAAWDVEERKNTRKIAEFVAKMEPQNSARLLTEMDVHQAARILGMLGERQAGAIMDSAVTLGDAGIERAVQWGEAIRRMRSGDQNAKP
jgi:flagellar motility protein MotE (MotC chaperone)